MNYSFMSFSCPEADLKTALQMAQRYGFRGFERSGPFFGGFIVCVGIGT